MYPDHRRHPLGYPYGVRSRSPIRVVEAMATAGSGGRRSALLRGGECGSEGSTCARSSNRPSLFSGRLLAARIDRGVASDDLDLVLGRLLASST